MLKRTVTRPGGLILEAHLGVNIVQPAAKHEPRADADKWRANRD